MKTGKLSVTNNKETGGMDIYSKKSFSYLNICGPTTSTTHVNPSAVDKDPEKKIESKSK